MAEFLRRALPVLDRIYNFRDGVGSLSRFDLSGAIIPVHDVSREAELGAVAAGAGGIFLTGHDLVHAGASTEEGAYDPYDNVEALLEISDHGNNYWVWMLDAWLTIANSNYTSGVLSLGTIPFANNIPRRDLVLRYWPERVAINDQGVSPATLTVAGLATYDTANWPVYVPPGSDLRVRSISTAANTARFDSLYWYGPLGVMPPGMS